MEARILAALIDDPASVGRRQMDAWAHDFDNWAVCDACCSVLFDKTPHAYAKAHQWSRRNAEFVKRAGFVMMAVLAVHDKDAPDAAFRRFFPPIRHGALDNRNFVKKAVSWAIRQIGKRNATLRADALKLAVGLRQSGNPSARWISADAIRELRAGRSRHKSP